MSNITKHDMLTKEIELKLQAIEEKYLPSTRLKYGSTELTKLLLKLSEEFDSLGLPVLDAVDPSSKRMLQALVSNVFTLIHMYRKSVKEINDVCLSKTQTDIQKSELKNNIEASGQKLKRREEQIQSLNRKIQELLNLNKKLEENNRKLHIELKLLKSAYNSKQNEYEHKLNSLQAEIQTLREKCYLTVGSFVSKDTVISQHLKTYKLSEEMYKDQILKLQRNNEQLVTEVVNLREELACSLLDRKNSENKHI